MKETLSVGMIGGGQMGEALIRGMIESGLTKAENITVAEPMVRRREYLGSTYQVKAVET
ncbi:NAD(P)-binding domain-containing protein, partial [Desulfobulbus sp. US1]|nr:NAD(P)-binding domain-containing protein [Desulfobulbus sp. US1]